MKAQAKVVLCRYVGMYVGMWQDGLDLMREDIRMPDSLYGARLQGFTVVVFIVAKSRALSCMV